MIPWNTNGITKKDALRRDPNLPIIFGISLISVMGAASISPALPRISQELGIPASSIGLLITVFTLPGVVLAPVSGVLSDRYGRKKVLVPSFILFGVAGGACAFVRDFDFLLILRFLQGIGAASLTSMSLTLVSDLYHDKDRRRVMGYNSGVLNTGMSCYPVVGGLLTTFGWQYPFLLPFLAIPIGVATLVILDNSEPQSEQPFKQYLTSVWVHARDPQLIALFLASMTTTALRYGPLFTFLPLLMSRSFGSSPLVIGIVLSSGAVVTVVIAVESRRLDTVFSAKSQITAAFVLYSFTMLLIPLMPTAWSLLLPALTFGLAHGINLPNVNTLIAESASSENRGAFMSINAMNFRLGQTIGPTLMGMIAVTVGISGAFYVASGVALAMFAVAIVLLR